MIQDLVSETVPSDLMVPLFRCMHHRTKVPIRIRIRIEHCRILRWKSLTHGVVHIQIPPSSYPVLQSQQFLEARMFSRSHEVLGRQ